MYALDEIQKIIKTWYFQFSVLRNVSTTTIHTLFFCFFLDHDVPPLSLLFLSLQSSKMDKLTINKYKSEITL
jgi:hypothetical protein